MILKISVVSDDSSWDMILKINVVSDDGKCDWNVKAVSKGERWLKEIKENIKK